MYDIYLYMLLLVRSLNCHTRATASVRCEITKKEKRGDVIVNTLAPYLSASAECWGIRLEISAAVWASVAQTGTCGD